MPPLAIVAVLVVKSRLAAKGDELIASVDPVASVAGPAAVNVPNWFEPLPGATTLPRCARIAPTDPLPLRVAEDDTVVRDEDAMDPSTCNVPWLTSVLPV